MGQGRAHDRVKEMLGICGFKSSSWHSHNMHDTGQLAVAPGQLGNSREDFGQHLQGRFTSKPIKIEVSCIQEKRETPRFYITAKRAKCH